MLLVVDDDQIYFKLISKIVDRLCPIEILYALNAEEGIALAQAYHPQLILMDIALPGMNGLRAVEVIRDTPDIQELPIIIVSAIVSMDNQRRAHELGCGFITKPFTEADIRDQVCPYLS